MSTTIASANATEQFSAAFATEVAPRLATAPAWLADLQRMSIEQVARAGFPTTHDEDWVYTSIAPITKLHYRSPRAGDNEVTAVMGAHSFGRDWCSLLVFVNGRFSAGLSQLASLPPGVRVMTFAEALRETPALMETRLGRQATIEGRGFTALNTAFIGEGAVVFVPRGVVLSKPVQLLYVSNAPEEPIACFPRNLIVLEEAAQAAIVENYCDLGEHVYFNCAVTEITIGEGAVCEHYKLEHESENAFHVATIQVEQARSSSFVSHSITSGGALVRNELNVVQSGEGCSTVMNGLYLAQGTQHIDNHTLVDHAAPHGTSVENYRGILDDRSRGVFNGKVLVRAGASKTDASQTNHNLLLTEDARIDTKPQLEIFNNDVKCAHGATVGQLDPAAIFYLRARGIDEKAARNLLTYAFASDIVGRLKIEPVRARLADYLAHRFSRELNLENAS